ncbi:SUF system Fe-S cluster assembly regulator [Alkalilimnicola sp. S0819]|uniref:SUF system Fe-S cluster assembly regulator n=1 Tax=Alkalilimnicola sp. S0819 TaxID=2613922 RepID=UPI001261C011|nr:SUF system Fe-S cluster assembly regulator [Alkalilimnicola sp. S0819]KAB7623636.1 SUF system Fe-S cluster assembly regulator [Alkalilimnicola sp. S0819]MPQ16760.1 SUF system Fe-S cluster assembly regulator [Alkalilimnicola sp. S0819]
MIRINRETDYAIVLLSLMAMEPDKLYSAGVLASQRGLPQPAVSKILKLLARSGMLVSARGAKGGYGLARPAEEITLAQIVTAMEGPIALTDCADEALGCQYLSSCVISSNWNHINRVVHRALDAISLKDMTRPLPEGGSGGLDEIYVSLANLS